MEPCQGFEELVLLKAAGLQSEALPLDRVPSKEISWG